MGDHFVFLVDRLLTEATLEAALESRNPSKQPDPVRNEDAVIDCSSHDVFTPKKLVECRICQDEDFDVNMETPCSCCGSLKYAHRRCVQRWCNEKGDTICEICHQQFKPGYTAPSPVFRLGGIPLNFRGHWQIARRDMNNNPQIIAVVSPERSFVDQEYDEYADSTSRSVFCFRSVAAIFVVLLFLRHALPVIANRAGSYSFSVFMYAHRRCVQRWCNEKGDTICEICHQQFKPGYTAPSPVFRLGGIPLNFRGHWQIARRDMNNNPQIIAVVSPERSFVDQEYDEYADSTSRSVFCFRSVAAIFVVLLFLRHALPVIANRAGSYSFSVFMLWFLRTTAIVLPIYVMMKAMMALIHRRRRLASNASSSSLSSSDEGETSLTPSQNQPRVARVD
ncbi:RING/FYVE/PHD zinc finger superfamily protein [Artemisia annua]|uniref:RING/FYVE/PHD zinc finger superfamily protein n=1 Tax=Artemisia annua TaxID=35608 RepID=A0A2U1L712_ARTAN|nr:RING/FYVE/PHD zinc finger superfamily protein [Artemisia annua]